MSEEKVRRTQAERSEQMQERVIDAAIELLREKGYAGFRVADVTEIAGVSRGAQSHHFPTKVSLAVAAFRRVFERSTEATRRRIAALGAKDDVIEAMMADAQDYFFGPDMAIGLDMIGASGRAPELRSEAQEIAKANRLEVEDLWRTALQKRGLAKADAEDIVWLVMSMIRGLAMRMLLQKDNARFKRVLRMTYEGAMEIYARRRR
ncbi:MAG: TetR/AcrR family transcriptional regulator [Gammaproteobacteria bacterium]|nr:TetR/AcrR family transcriptional regulator [Gammaproteobacteria bacterium]MBI5619263.1 TetR/AcrR family transcriptional regulator [Gammaproteobacteria bacterium]